MSRLSCVAAAASALMAVAGSLALAQPANPAVRPDLSGQVSALAPEALYQGWRARAVIGKTAVGKDGREVGVARDLIVDADGRLAALIVEGGGALDLPEAVYRVPWSHVTRTPAQDSVAVDLSTGRRPQYGLFPGTEGVMTLPREFRLTEVLGDYARLQTGYGYGYVTDVVFSGDGRMIAVLVSRDAAAGGGTFAFPYPGTTGPWDPALSYYGLPFVTESQATMAGLRVDPKRFTAD